MIILQDTKEKKPWNFDFFGFPQELQHLDTADYTIKGYEDKVRIERKRTSGELAINLGSKSKQFMAEMERLSKYTYRYVICEFPESYINQFPVNSGIPQKQISKIRIPSFILRSKIEMIKADYGIEFIFTNGTSEAEQIAMDIFLKVINEN